MQSISVVLCNDKPQTFGAPDVLRVSVDQLMVKHVMEQHFHDRPPDQVKLVVFEPASRDKNLKRAQKLKYFKARKPRRIR